MLMTRKHRLQDRRRADRNNPDRTRNRWRYLSRVRHDEHQSGQRRRYLPRPEHRRHHHKYYHAERRGSAPESITVANDSGTTNITTGNGTEKVNVQGTGAAGSTTITTGIGSNTINLGSKPRYWRIPRQPPRRDHSSWKWRQLTAVNLDDTATSIAKTGQLTATTITGLGTGGVTYSGVGTLNINLGNHGNTFTIASTSGNTTTTLNGGSGNDNIYVQSTAAGPSTTINTGAGTNLVDVTNTGPTPGILNGIQGPLIVNGGGNDILTLDDSASAAGKTGTLTNSTVTGLGMGPAGVVYHTIHTLNINLGSGGDMMNVQSTAAVTTTTIDTGVGANIVNLGSLAPATGGILNNLAGPLTINGHGSDILNVDDTGSAASKTDGVLTARPSPDSERPV